MRKFDFTEYEITELWDIVAEVGQKLFLKHSNKTDTERKKKQFYGYIVRMVNDEINRRMEQDYDVN